MENKNSDNIDKNTVLTFIFASEERIEKSIENIWHEVSEIRENLHSIDKVVNNGLSHRTQEIHERSIENQNRIHSIHKMFPRIATKKELLNAIDSINRSKEEAEKNKRVARRYLITTLISAGGLLVSIMFLFLGG